MPVYGPKWGPCLATSNWGLPLTLIPGLTFLQFLELHVLLDYAIIGINNKCNISSIILSSLKWGPKSKQKHMASVCC